MNVINQQIGTVFFKNEYSRVKSNLYDEFEDFTDSKKVKSG